MSESYIEESKKPKEPGMNTTTNTRGVSEAMTESLETLRRMSEGWLHPDTAVLKWMYETFKAALSAPEPAAQAVGEIIRPAKSRNAPVGASVRWFDREPPVGTKLYTAPLAQPAERVPEGWVLVPREPTEEMLEATRKCVASTLVNMSIRRTIYRAMLAASPATSPARGDGGEG